MQAQQNILTSQQFNFTKFVYMYSHVPLRQSYCVYMYSVLA